MFGPVDLRLDLPAVRRTVAVWSQPQNKIGIADCRAGPLDTDGLDRISSVIAQPGRIGKAERHAFYRHGMRQHVAGGTWDGRGYGGVVFNQRIEKGAFTGIRRTSENNPEAIAQWFGARAHDPGRYFALQSRKAGAKIIFVTCWPGSELQNFVDLQIAPAVGPEIIAGSTRLKAGTATKMVLNMLTTIAMIKLGKTYGNLMVDVQTGSEKLKDRARRILVLVTGIDYEAAGVLLKLAKWNVKAAIIMQRADLTLPQALRRLKKAHDSVREAIGEEDDAHLRELLEASQPPARPA